MLKFGYSEREINPSKSMRIPGYYNHRYVSGVRDDLFAKAVVLDDGKNAFVIVVCDCININRDEVLRIRYEVGEACNIPHRNIHVCSTHIHTGGPSWGRMRQSAYLTKLVNASIEAAKAAFDARVPAKIGFAKTELPGYAWVRRYKMKDGSYTSNPANLEDIVGPASEPDVSVIIGKVTDMNEKPIAFISNYGVHCDMVAGTEACADYPGEIARAIKEKYGEGCNSLFFAGPCGNTNHVNGCVPYTPETYKDIHIRTGRALFDKIVEKEAEIKLSDDVKLMGDYEFIAAKLRRPSEEEYISACAYADGRDVSLEAFPGFNKKIECIKEGNANGVIGSYRNPRNVLDVEVSALSINDEAVVAFLPGEFFTEYGKQIRDAFPEKNVFISELADSTITSYVPTQDAVDEGGYEAMVTSLDNIEPKCAEMMISAVIDIIKGF